MAAKENRSLLFRFVLARISLAVVVGAIVLAAVSWTVGFQHIALAIHAVLLPTGFVAKTVFIPGAVHVVAGWWVDSGAGSPVVLLAPQPSGFDAVVLESVYPRITSAIEGRLQIFLGPLAPLVLPLLLSQLEPIRFIGRLGARVLVAAGSRDEHTTFAESQELFGAGVEPKEFSVLEGAAYQDLLRVDPKGYEDHVVGF